MSFGKMLIEQRLRLGLSLEEVEEETKIRKYYLEALENDNFVVLPPPVYASGFVKRYALLLGLDEQETVAQFRELAYGKEEPDQVAEEPVAVVRQREPRKPLPVKNIAAGVIFLALAIVIGSFIASYISNRGQEKAANPNKVQQVQPNTQQQQQQQQQQQPAVQPPTATQSGVTVELEAIARCWVSITVDGKISFTGTLVPGDKKTFNGKTSIKVNAGNPPGLKVTVNGVL